jgi:2-keto-4-pentenoate hydratase/2-oxohepta-3-ene-1,7-dioic acid hydratase in catechol pathway
MFTPRGLALDRGWPGRIDGDRVVQLAAQTLQSFFTGGGSAREHAEYALDDVVLRAPVMYPSSIRVFEGHGSFRFENPAGVYGPGDEVPWPATASRVTCFTRVAAVIGAGNEVGGFTIFGDWHAPELEPPKDTDFGQCIGPLVVTPDEFEPGGGWRAFVAYAALNTVLRPGDLLAFPAVAQSDLLGPGDEVALEVEGIGVLRSRIGATSA